MRSYLVLVTLCWLHVCMQWVSFTSAIDVVEPEDPAPVDPEPADPNNPSPNENPITPNEYPITPYDSSGEPFPGIDSSPKANAPGALYEGKDPEPSENDEDVDIGEIGEKLHDLVDAIESGLGTSTTSATATQTTFNANSSSPTPTIIDLDPPSSPIPTQPPLPSGARNCQSAHQAYVNCSSPSNAFDFANSNQTEKAGCLCNAYPGIDFNAYVAGCYSWAQAQNGQTNATVYHSYATAIANATTLCAPCPSSQGCGATSTAAAAVSYTLAPPTGDAVRSSGRNVRLWFLLMATFWAAIF